MKLGVDFGTNRTVVAAADRGNYPLVSFETADGLSADWFPSLVAFRGNQRRYGWDAWELQADSSWTVVRSLKRLLEDAGPDTMLELDEQQMRLLELLHGFTASLRSALVERSNLRIKAGEPLEIMLGVPANANSNQRFLTVEAFRAAGFHILGVLNEPSAASIEFGHRQRQSKSAQQTILVYDLGGGTFDASLVTLDEHVHHVIASEGIATIGGDDFDQILAEMALEAAGVSLAERDEFPAAVWFRLLEECRVKKESLNPNSRRIAIDLEQVDPAWETVQVPVVEFYEAVRPLVEETIEAAEDLLRDRNEEFEALYITGGGSELPLVARVLRERFGRRVRRSAYTRSATAIGLAIQADQPQRYRVSDRLSRYFGVWREADGGSRIVFDPLFEKGAPLPPAGEPALSIRRSYWPVHNIGHFRFLECSHRGSDGAPSGEVTVWDEIRFPFEPELQESKDLASCPVLHSDRAPAQHIEEAYECDAGGAITVRILNESSGYERTYQLGHWSERGSAKAIKADGRKKGGTAGRSSGAPVSV
ncbi:MAG TPA: Hsp70 family protein [Bryobacteraceae bacterium]|jgi:molecular chaperone DnaK (HSP70)|nr:Hsp70 family protein [Bryobacteraceae bacterium]